MSEKGEVQETSAQPVVVNKNKRYRKEKPWDNDPTLDKFVIEDFKPEDNPHQGVVEESSFSVLFPQYREKYIKEIWPLIKKALKPLKIEATLDAVEGSMSVKTTRQTWDPYSIIRARDLVKLLARSVPYQQAVKILNDSKMFCEVIKIGGIVRNREKFVKRRQRLVGPNGMTLKALELLTSCYILVQGNTVSVMGEFRELKTVQRIVVDCMQNVHPIYSIKELMIKKELMKNPDMKNENWERFMPHFKKQNVKRKKVKQERKKKEYTPFPPEQLPRKEDIQMMTGEYFLSEKAKDDIKREKKRDQKDTRKSDKAQERNKTLAAPVEEEAGDTLHAHKYVNKKPQNVDDLKSKFLKKK